MHDRKSILSKIKNSISVIDPDARIILFGSRARGDYGKESDWDLLVLTSIPATEENKRNIRYNLLDVELEIEESISTLIHHRDQWQNYSITPIYEVIEMEGLEV